MTPDTVRLGLPRGKFVRVDRERNGEWETVRVYRLEDVLSIPLDVAHEMLSCGCGSYPYGECELCNDEAEGTL